MDSFWFPGIISFIVITAPLEIIIMLIMIFTLEEKEVVKKIGDAYIAYKKSSGILP